MSISWKAVAVAVQFGWIVSAADPVSFNKDVRPILSDRCFQCHGPDSAARKSKLRLDREAEAKPYLKEVAERITSTNRVKRMPPAYMGHDPLTPKQIDILKAWIELGGQYEPHWSLIPPKRDAARNIDQIVHERLAREDLQASKEASRATLIRRVTLDLNGLPPTPAEVDSFMRDGNYEQVVDRLLASPRYAERMTIRWLEAARYADTNGYQSDGPRDMWRWRDWVLDAFQTNMPWDRFTIEQIAGDLLPNATVAQKVATAFNRNHSTSAEGGIVDEEYRVQYVADRAETTATVWLGLTVGCARCHDHKYDPIRQKDYYQLFAFFNNVPEKGFVYNFGNEEPYIYAPLPDQQKKLDELDREIAAARKRVEALEPKVQVEQARWEQHGPPKSEDWTPTQSLQFRSEKVESFDGKRVLDASKDAAKFNYRDPFTFAAWVNPASKNGAILSRGEDYLEGTGHYLHLIDGKLRLHVTFRWTDLGMRMETEDPLPLNEWQHVLVTYDGGMKASGVHMYVNGQPRKVKILFDQGIWPLESKEPFRIGAGGGLRFTGSIRDVRVYTRALSDAEAGAIPALDDEGRRAKLHLWFLEKYAPKDVTDARAELTRLEGQKKKYLEGVSTVMVMAERENPRESFILKRGAYDAPSEKVQANVPEVLPGLKPQWPRNRLGLAYWMVDRQNPPTARVTVNRFWQMLFGAGLVKTVEDFGAQGEWPQQQELLDWLAVEFMDSGWDVKHILKTIVMSDTYRQSSNAPPELWQRDPENRLLARGPRERLAAEMIRDQALAVSGLLVEKLGGPSVKPLQPEGLWQELNGGKGYEPDKGEGLWRRSLYSYWKRTVAPPNMINFDSPTRETCVVRETRTNTPLQALNLMNDPQYLEAARKLGERMLREGGANDDARINYGFKLVLAREPGAEELGIFEGALSKFRTYYGSHPDDARKFDKSPESAAYAGIGSLLLNMDETVTKE